MRTDWLLPFGKHDKPWMTVRIHKQGERASVSTDFLRDQTAQMRSNGENHAAIMGALSRCGGGGMFKREIVDASGVATNSVGVFLSYMTKRLQMYHTGPRGHYKYFLTPAKAGKRP